MKIFFTFNCIRVSETAGNYKFLPYRLHLFALNPMGKLWQSDLYMISPFKIIKLMDHSE